MYLREVENIQHVAGLCRTEHPAHLACNKPPRVPLLWLDVRFRPILKAGMAAGAGLCSRLS